MAENKKETPKKVEKPKGVSLNQPTWGMALPGLITALRGEHEDSKKMAVNQLAVLCHVMDIISIEAGKNDAFLKRLEHLNIRFKGGDKNG